MIREIEATGKTVEEAKENGCAMLGVSADDINVSYEVLAFPERHFFKSTPAKVKVTVELPDEEKPAEAPVAAAPAAPVAEPVAAAEPEVIPAEEPAAPAEEAKAPAEEPAEPTEAASDEEEVIIDLSQNPKAKAAVDYLAEVSEKMGVKNAVFTAVQKGEATIIRVEGNGLGVMIGRRGETMESLSYLASLVANRQEGEYMKLGLDVAGYRGKREQDLTVLAQRIGEKVRRTGRAFAMESMNPYERRVIHSAITEMEGVRSESAGEGKDRHVVIYSTAPDASTLEPETERSSRGRNDRGGRPGNRGGRSFNRGGRGDRGGKGGYRGDKGGRGGKGGYRGSKPSRAPERDYETRTADQAEPVAPKRTERVDDFADFGFGKISF